MIKTIVLVGGLSLIVSCGTFLNTLEPTKGIHGYDNSGIIYSNTARSEDVTPEIGSKRGVACQAQFIALMAWGDASLPAALKSGGITKLKHVSYERTRVLGTPITAYVPIYSTDCLIASGD